MENIRIEIQEAKVALTEMQMSFSKAALSSGKGILILWNSMFALSDPPKPFIRRMKNGPAIVKTAKSFNSPKKLVIPRSTTTQRGRDLHEIEKKIFRIKPEPPLLKHINPPFLLLFSHPSDGNRE